MPAKKVCLPAERGAAQPVRRGRRRGRLAWRRRPSCADFRDNADRRGPTGAGGAFADPFEDGVRGKVVAAAAMAEATGPRVEAEDSIESQASASKERLPSFETLTRKRPAPTEVCPTPESFRPICALTNNISASEGDLPQECGLGNRRFQPRCWAAKTYCWTASGLCHKPLYFEDEQLERYGHSCGPLLQPLVSTGKFFLTLPILPYEMGLYPPNECIYTLGVYRPGDCSPYMFDAIPLSVRASVFEAGGLTGAIVGLP